MTFLVHNRFKGNFKRTAIFKMRKQEPKGCPSFPLLSHAVLLCTITAFLLLLTSYHTELYFAVISSVFSPFSLLLFAGVSRQHENNCYHKIVLCI